MRPDFRPAAIALVTALALSGCQGEKKAATQATAGGEVLPGSTSDAMLPIDSLRSQPPLAPRPESSGRAPAGKAEASGGAMPKEAPPVDAPAEEPKTEPTVSE